MAAGLNAIDMFARQGALVEKDVSPWQTFSGKGMAFRLQAFDWNGCAALSSLAMRAFCGLMRMDTLICTPYAKDLPLYSLDLIHALGRHTLLVEVYDTQLAPADLSAMMAVKETAHDLKDKPVKPNWYDHLRLPPCTCKTGPANRLSTLADDMTAAYLGLFPAAPDADRTAKTARSSAYVEGLIAHGGPAINTIRSILGPEAAETLFRRLLFGTGM